MMKRGVTLVSLFMIVIIIGAAVYFMNPDRLTPDNPAGKTIYYTIINNSQIESDNNERYNYSLDVYNKQGKKKELTFSASKQLHEGALLELYVTPLRGVTFWQEIQPKQLPARIRNIFAVDH